MTKILIPLNFDGNKFSKKYNLTLSDFRSDGEYLICPSLDSLTNDDLLDCVADLPSIRLSPSQQIILANGLDTATVTLIGKPGEMVDFTVNGEPQSLVLNDSGMDTLELTCDTPNTTLLVQAGTAKAVIYAVEVPL